MIDSDTVVVDLLNVTLPSDALADRVGVVARAVSTRATVLVLGGIHLRAEAGRLELAATDMDLSLRSGLDADVDGGARRSSPAGCCSMSSARFRMQA